MSSRVNILVPPNYDNYISSVKEDKLIAALKKSTKQFRKLLNNIPKKKVDFAYAEGKWTIRELLQHIIDAERVFVFRALWFARKDPSPLPGFSENTWAVDSNASARDWNDLIDEFTTVRDSTIALFSSFNEEQLLSKGTANNNEMNVVGIGFVCAGHVQHHIRIIKERYLKVKK